MTDIIMLASAALGALCIVLGGDPARVRSDFRMGIARPINARAADRRSFDPILHHESTEVWIAKCEKINDCWFWAVTCWVIVGGCAAWRGFFASTEAERWVFLALGLFVWLGATMLYVWHRRMNLPTREDVRFS